MLGRLKVVYEDGTEVEVQTKPVDGIRFERQFQRPVTDAFGDSMRMEYLWFFAWSAAWRDAGETREFDDWVNAVVTVEMAGEKRPPSKRARTSSP